jgi:hypothetical protein
MVYNVADVLPQMRQIAATNGFADAESDFSNGIYRVEVYGLRGASGTTSERYLTTKYGIVIDAVTGCIVTDQILGHAEGYNARMKDLLLSKYGKDIFSEADVMAILQPIMTPMNISVISNRVVLTTSHLSEKRYKEMMARIQEVLGTNAQVTLIVK